MKFFSRGGEDPPTVQIMFLCVENAGRSQMAAALAERERERRGLEDRVEIRSAGTHPEDEVNPTVVDVLAEAAIDISDRRPTLVDLEELRRMDFVVMMGCYVAEFNPATFGGDSREWNLKDPSGQDEGTVRAIRDELERKVVTLFDDVEEHLSES
jgi:protein-tyrosine-phosphatase